MDLYETEEGDDSQQTRYIMWAEEQENDNQRPILQPMSGNGMRRKLKGRVETRQGAKERSTNMTALKLFTRQGKEKSQLEDWKADLLRNLTNKIAQIHKAHSDSMEAQREEIEKQRKQFQFEIEILRERIWELEIEKERSLQDQTRRSESAEMSEGEII